MKAMIHTIQEINQRKDILPNVTLGYQIFDTCSTISKVMESAMVLLTGQEENKPNIRNSTGAYLAGVIGSGASSLSIASSRILGLYLLPQVFRTLCWCFKGVEMGCGDTAAHDKVLAVAGPSRRAPAGPDCSISQRVCTGSSLEVL